MMRYGRGVLCVPMTEERCDELEATCKVPQNTSLHGTPFTVTVDLLGKGVTTGVSMHDRATTIRALADHHPHTPHRPRTPWAHISVACT